MTHLILDIGNVLANVNLQVFADDMSRLLKISDEKAWVFLRKVQKAQDLGHITVKESLQDDIGLPKGDVLDTLVSSWLNTIHINHEVVGEIASYVQGYDYKVAILSNMGFEHKNHMEACGLFKDAIKYYSCDIGVRKPTEMYYWSFLQRYPEFNGATYLDDMPDNINTGKKLGLNAITFDISNCVSGKISDRIKQELKLHLGK